MRYLHSPFSIWVLPLRLAGAAIMVAGLVRIMIASDFTAIAVAVAGSLIWLAGTLVEERSSLSQMLEATPVSQVMRSRLIPVASWWSLAKVRAQFPAIDVQSFFVTTESGYLTGIVLPEWVWDGTHEASRYKRMEEICRPIEYVHAVRQDATVLAAFSHLRLLPRDYLSVTDASNTLVGVITRGQISGFMDGSSPSREAPDTGGHFKQETSDVNPKLAA